MQIQATHNGTVVLAIHCDSFLWQWKEVYRGGGAQVSVLIRQIVQPHDGPPSVLLYPQYLHTIAAAAGATYCGFLYLDAYCKFCVIKKTFPLIFNMESCQLCWKYALNNEY